jgi:hypothetical protein
MTRATRQPAQFPVLTPQAELLAMLAMRRPAWSKTERNFIYRYLRPLGLQEDELGNLYKRIGDAPVLWSSHTDTVHTHGGTQLLRLSNGIISQSDKSSNCLGADCTAGVWLMMQMIRANRPGLYVFHRAEEVGGKGSEFIAKNRPDILEGIKYAIAFDRRGHGSIITHQWGGRCCSEAFSVSLSKALGMSHDSDSGGSFTDTANYIDLIGECSNLSVGYMNEHTKRETLDFDYLDTLRAALLKLDASTLVQERQPGDIDPADWEDDVTRWGAFDDDDQMPRGFASGSLASLVRNHPDEVADWLEEYGITAEEVATAVYLRGGVIRR